MSAATMQVSARKAPLPEELKKAMALYRADLADLPQGYIDWQYDLAYRELVRLGEAHGLRVLVKGAVADDFFPDGMAILRACVETRSGRLVALQWHDGNQGFLKRCPGGGWSMTFAEDLA